MDNVKNVLCDFCEPDNWDSSEQYHQKGSYTQYIWTGNNDPMALAESALDELDAIAGEVERLSAIVENSKNETCEWIEIDSEIYKTSCNSGHIIFIDPEAVDYLYCPYCGKRIKY